MSFHPRQMVFQSKLCYYRHTACLHIIRWGSTDETEPDERKCQKKHRYKESMRRKEVLITSFRIKDGDSQRGWRKESKQTESRSGKKERKRIKMKNVRRTGRGKEEEKSIKWKGSNWSQTIQRTERRKNRVKRVSLTERNVHVRKPIHGRTKWRTRKKQEARSEEEQRVYHHTHTHTHLSHT